jgi:hypothetical protein
MAMGLKAVAVQTENGFHDAVGGSQSRVADKGRGAVYEMIGRGRDSGVGLVTRIVNHYDMKQQPKQRRCGQVEKLPSCFK